MCFFVTIGLAETAFIRSASIVMISQILQNIRSTAQATELREREREKSLHTKSDRCALSSLQGKIPNPKIHA